jgi:hypothetical protein
MRGGRSPRSSQSVSISRIRPPTSHTLLVSYVDHSDIGLLSLVFGDKPGLEVYDRRLDNWYPIEQLFTQPTASVLVGKQLFHLTNRCYRPGPHRVVSSANPPPSDQNAPPTPNYRYSIVFILRAHSPVPINTAALTTPFTGQFVLPMTGMTANDLYKEISSQCFNINIDPEIRKVQKEKMRKRAEEAAAKMAEEAAATIGQGKDGEHSKQLNPSAALGGGISHFHPRTFLFGRASSAPRADSRSTQKA